jgi:HAE1 family hydrophobic/amphiphilic exporter-1
MSAGSVGRVRQVDDFKDVIIASRDPKDGGEKSVLRVRHVADVEDAWEEPRGASRLDGEVAVSLVIQKKSGGNTVTVADAVKARLAKIRPTLPADIRVEVIRDQSKFIKGSIEEVKFHLVLAAVLVSGVIFLFIRDWRTTVIAALAVPTSIIGTFAFMDAMGFSLNNMTLLGLILAVGIVIDDAVVVLENVFRHMEEYGKTPWQAAGEATKEIALAVLATTLSLAVIFAPIAFMSGQVGRFFNSFGFVVGFAILLSMVVSFTLTPMLCARFLRPVHTASGGRQPPESPAVAGPRDVDDHALTRGADPRPASGTGSPAGTSAPWRGRCGTGGSSSSPPSSPSSARPPCSCSSAATSSRRTTRASSRSPSPSARGPA